ncbi:hypothetical protein AbraIFM66950_000327 [Aspergillus brasiliensis]|nr:hypothetical protein AbraIFM66950_000327 [Aspergillus brasiliensis]
MVPISPGPSSTVKGCPVPVTGSPTATPAAVPAVQHQRLQLILLPEPKKRKRDQYQQNYDSEAIQNQNRSLVGMGGKNGFGLR